MIIVHFLDATNKQFKDVFGSYDEYKVSYLGKYNRVPHRIKNNFKLHNDCGYALCIFDENYLNTHIYQIIYAINGNKHRLDGPAYLYINFLEKDHYKLNIKNIEKELKSYYFNIIDYYIDDKKKTIIEFTKETNHILCKNCNNFCNQNVLDNL